MAERVEQGAMARRLLARYDEWARGAVEDSEPKPISAGSWRIIADHVRALEAENARVLVAANVLFRALDAIDTADDIAKDDDKLYRGLVRQEHKKRFTFADASGAPWFDDGHGEDDMRFNASPAALKGGQSDGE